ncbi:MerR family transcriptional regulator [Cellulomonas hominis]
MDMAHHGARLLTIGEFSRLSRISIRMLRHYDERGLLVPSAVDTSTGYRYYAPDLLRTADRVRALRDIGCSISEIGAMLPAFDDPARLRLGLAEQRSRLEVDERAVRSRIARVDRLISELQEITMPIETRRMTVPAFTALALRDMIPAYQDEGVLWQRLMAELGATGATVPDAALCGATFHDDDFREHDVDVEVWLQVAGGTAPGDAFSSDHTVGAAAATSPSTGADVDAAAGTARFVRMPAQEVVAATLHGPYDGVSAVSGALGTWVAENGAVIAGPMLNIYVVGPTQSHDPADWVTEVCVPIAPQG